MNQQRIGAPALALAVAVPLLLAGCGDMFGPAERPIMPEEYREAYNALRAGPLGEAAVNVQFATREEQVAWAVAEVDEALGILGQEEGWYDLQGRLEGKNWAAARDRDAEDFVFIPCGYTGEEFQGSQLQLTLVHNHFTDTNEAAERLRGHWEWEGWEVIDDVTTTQAYGERVDYVLVREPAGSTLAIDADSTAIVLDFVPGCSSTAWLSAG